MTFLERLKVEQFRIFRASKSMIGSYVLITSAAYFYLDVFHFESDLGYLWLGFAVWGFGYIVFVDAMNRGGYFFEGKKAGVGSYFAITLVTSMLIAVGLVALVLPGLYLLMRWLGAYSRVLASEDGVGNSMRWSWERTEEVQKELAINLMPPVILFALGIALRYFYEAYYDYFDWNGFYAISLAWNLVDSVANACLIILASAVYGCLEVLD